VREYVIEQLRKCSYVKGKQATWVSQLSDDEIYELFLRLRRGQSAKAIARHFQKVQGINPESTVHSISQGILKFRRRIAHLLLSPPLDSTSPTDLKVLEEAALLEGPEGVERIAQLQLARIERMMTEEEETGIKHTSLSRELQALSTLMKCQLQLKEWDIKYEAADPVKRRALERTKKRLAARFTGLIDSTGGGDRLLKATQRFLELAEEQALTIEVGPEGK
jgi:hypothetical protein